MQRLALSVQSLLLRELESLSLELAAYPDEASVWATPPGAPNSGGTLILHMTGNLQHFIGARLGDSGYVRDREAEFALRNVSRQRLREEIAAAEGAIRETLADLDDDRVSMEFPDPIRDHFFETSEFLLHLAVHLGYHLGQVSYHRRLTTGDSRGVGALDPAGLSTARPASA